ncbi:DUF3289 family protein [Salmonella enterica subsp. salamae]|uniref:DUF3289 family protein n=1 Tax=Salmonella enterica subsp. salamae TaxID=59202 RepID=A0A5Y2S6G1_SALER|nr:DUF3289 family protein [Salmonella enterica subsp. salamae]ECJ2313594.1 DUF3289 family protein [Salmonella enterica subsp. salamae]
MIDTSIHLPYTLFETISRFNDNDADDMQYGDMGEPELKSLGLTDISAYVDPYNLIRYTYPQPGSVYNEFKTPSPGEKISYNECIDILFSEMKELSKQFSFYGEYKTIIHELIDHFRYGNGSTFYSQKLNSAFHKRIHEYTNDNPLLKIEDIIEKHFRSLPRSEYVPSLLYEIQTKLLSSRLPKFNEYKDRVNGLGISVHDIAAQKIILLDLKKYAIGWSAIVHFDAQDHFGLDTVDIKNDLYKNFRFFRIWFFLQRNKNFAFKPFFTNFNSVERIGSYI